MLCLSVQQEQPTSVTTTSVGVAREAMDKRIHIDYAGPFMNRMFLVIVDAHTKWLEVHVTQTSTAAVTIQKLQQTFATLGLPETVVSDNGSAFTSHEFQEFMKQNGIAHVKNSPYHPSSNGLAERAVQTFKTAMKRMFGVVLKYLGSCLSTG